MFLITYINIKGIYEWNKDNDSPKLMIDVKVIAKRSKVTHFHREDNGLMFNTLASIYYVTFQVESGDKMEMRVNAKDYRIINEGDKGKLIFQGNRYISFEKEYL